MKLIYEQYCVCNIYLMNMLQIKGINLNKLSLDISNDELSGRVCSGEDIPH